MRKDHGGRIFLSASDLARHLSCRHLTNLDLAVAEGRLAAPDRFDPALALLQERGLEHEQQYVERLRGEGLSVVAVAQTPGAEAAVARTEEAMREGTDVVVQAALVSDRWHGRADVLRRVDRPSDLGAWSYEVVDTKLARETRAGTLLQLCLYSDIVREIQGILPESMHVVPPGFELETFRVLDFLAYYRFVRGRLDEGVGEGRTATYPEPTSHCDICRWRTDCDGRRRADDHLCLVAGISKLQTAELRFWGVETLESLANLPLPLERRPRRGAPEGYVRIREQARLQLEARRRGAPGYELLPREEGRGLARLPEPSRGDLFFDLEGDPFVGDGGQEYLFGWVLLGDDGEPAYHRRWALRPSEEHEAFVAFVDTVIERWSRDPKLHVYHFAPYEPATLKRLMGRYAAREDEIDRMLRAELFVDLHAVVRQAVRAGVESYSIKDLEVLYGYRREESLRDAATHRFAVERGLELGRVDAIPDSTLGAVERYNRDDCLSALRLREWLEERRAQLVSDGEKIARPETKPGDPGEELDEKLRRTRELMNTLIDGVPSERSERSDEQQGRWLLAYMLEWHRREEKAPWWEYFRLRDLSDEDLLEERAAISGLAFREAVGGTDRCPIHRYAFPPQETNVRAGDELHAGEVAVGTAEAIDAATRQIDVKKKGATADLHPSSLFAHTVVRAGVVAESLARLGGWIAEHGVDGNGPHRAARDILLRQPPRLLPGSGGVLQLEGETVVGAARRLALELDHGVLPIQGPPGSGKTFTGARMICDLVRAGKRVGVTAVSHKVIRTLLDNVARAAEEEGISVACVHKVGGKPDGEAPHVTEVTRNDAVLAALESGEAQVGGGTVWLWSRPEYFETLDVLVVDEAGQMSLANVLAASQAARNLVLLGDPQQLEQPQQGSHPEGTAVSVLEHLLAGDKTIAADRGLFLAETWRLHPALCEFTSELFYEGRLHSRAGLERQRLGGSTPLAGSGLWFVPVAHQGNQTSSPEEVEQTARIVRALLADGTWTDRERAQAPLTPADILVVAPYNDQVAALAERLGPDARVGTVDKFQGQQAPVVIYSMATSSPEEAPRGMEFLYSLNRLNVATSRALCGCILVASPLLFEPECKTPRQMQLANAYCRYLESATAVSFD